MVWTRKKKQSNRRLHSQVDDSDQDIIIDNTMRIRQENGKIREGTVDQEFTVHNSDIYPTANENLVNVKTLERLFIDELIRK